MWQLLLDKYGPEENGTGTPSPFRDVNNGGNGERPKVKFDRTAVMLNRDRLHKHQQQQQQQQHHNSPRPPQPPTSHNVGGNDESLNPWELPYVLRPQPQEAKPSESVIQTFPFGTDPGNLYPIEMEKNKEYWAQRVLRYYKVRNPSHATPHQISQLLEKFQKFGYPMMWKMLLEKYGPEPEEEPTEPEGQRSKSYPEEMELSRPYWAKRLLRYYKVRDPSQATPQHVEDVLTTFERYGYPLMWNMLIEKYGPEPTTDYPPELETDPTFWSTRVMNYYKHMCPELATHKHVLELLDKFKKFGYPYMWDMLQQKYGPEPANPNKAILPFSDRLYVITGAVRYDGLNFDAYTKAPWEARAALRESACADLYEAVQCLPSVDFVRIVSVSVSDVGVHRTADSTTLEFEVDFTDAERGTWEGVRSVVLRLQTMAQKGTFPTERVRACGRYTLRLRDPDRICVTAVEIKQGYNRTPATQATLEEVIRSVSVNPNQQQRVSLHESPAPPHRSPLPLHPQRGTSIMSEGPTMDLSAITPIRPPALHMDSGTPPPSPPRPAMQSVEIQVTPRAKPAPPPPPPKQASSVAVQASIDTTYNNRDLRNKQRILNMNLLSALQNGKEQWKVPSVLDWAPKSKTIYSMDVHRRGEGDVGGWDEAVGTRPSQKGGSGSHKSMEYLREVLDTLEADMQTH
eukprot:PhF_6_TR13708/c0_g1_i3/m.22143